MAAHLGDVQTFVALVRHGNPAPMRVPGPDGRSPLEKLHAALFTRVHRTRTDTETQKPADDSSTRAKLIRLRRRVAAPSEVDGCAVRAALLNGETAGALCPTGASANVPHAPLLRSTLWKLLLGYMPWSYADGNWEKSAARRRAAYRILIQEHFMRPTV